MQTKRTLAGRPGHNRGTTQPAEVLSADEVRVLLRATNKGATGTRNRALIAALYRSGLRLAEALALRPADVDLDAGTVRVLHGKGDRARTVGMDDGAAGLIARWLSERQKLGLNGRHRLFCRLDGSPWAPQAVREMLRRVAAKAGVDKRVHPHGLRHAHAAELAREGTSVRLIQQQLGHASLGVTDRYLRSIAPEEAIAAIRRREWDL
jgi:site-specific recombinase XerD